MLTKSMKLQLGLILAAILLSVSFVAAAESGLTNWALGAAYTYSIEPNEGYPDTGGQLTDGVFGRPGYTDKAWVGHLRNDFRVITVDLGSLRPVQEIRANFLQDNSVAVRYPREVIAEVSVDGRTWKEVGFRTFDPYKMDLDKGFTQPTVFSGLDHEARYVRLVVVVDVWMFIDEVEVLGMAK